MNFWVADPEWGWWIIFYFFLGGIAAGSYFMATLIELLGSDEDRELPRIGYWVAFPLIAVCGLLLIADLHVPSRFWHMLVKSEVVDEAVAMGWPGSAKGWSLIWHAPLVKVWSPMSLGSWALTGFGLCSFLSFLGSLKSDTKFTQFMRRGWFGRTLQVVGCFFGLLVAAYTGSLLTATNQPIWSDSVWIASLFLTSAASSSIALMLLIAHWRKMGTKESLERLERADLWALTLEVLIFTVFFASLGGLLLPMLNTIHGKVVLATLLLGVLLPLAVHLRIGGARRWSMPLAAWCALIGGFFFRYGIIKTPPEILERGPSIMASFSPEDERTRGGGRGADPNNRGEEVVPRSKLNEKH
ncbi:MAG TPA: NrfD/PsrC family molybdoenzyme membrane anchor subunit [Gemmataceae bacterium]|nr:NrfD/PsrC family molybdoenzyme membrane anchor subunit [Gemmataceae bacterium]